MELITDFVTEFVGPMLAAIGLVWLLSIVFGFGFANGKALWERLERMGEEDNENVD